MCAFINYNFNTYKVHLKNTKHHCRWNMHMKINKCMHETFHGRLSELAQAYNTTTLNSRSLKMIVFQEFGKILPFLTWQLCGGLIKDINNLSYE